MPEAENFDYVKLNPQGELLPGKKALEFSWPNYQAYETEIQKLEDARSGVVEECRAEFGLAAAKEVDKFFKNNRLSSQFSGVIGDMVESLNLADCDMGKLTKYAVTKVDRERGLYEIQRREKLASLKKLGFEPGQGFAGVGNDLDGEEGGIQIAQVDTREEGGRIRVEDLLSPTEDDWGGNTSRSIQGKATNKESVRQRDQMEKEGI